MDEQTELEEATRLRWESGRKDFEAYARETGESPSEYDGIVRSTVRHARATYQKDRAFEELDEYHVDWDRISPKRPSHYRNWSLRIPKNGKCRRS